MNLSKLCLVSLVNLLFLGLFGCGSSDEGFNSERKINPVTVSKDVEEERDKTEFLHSLPIELKIPVGHARPIALKIPNIYLNNNSLGRLICNGKDIVYTTRNDRLIAYLSMSYKEPRDYECRLELESRPVVFLKVEKVNFEFKVERLNVAKKHVDLSKEAVERWKREMKIQKKVYGESSKSPYFDEPFMSPLNSFITSPYGVKRLFNNKKESWHSGTDFRGAVGTPIPAANRGKVVFTGDLFFNGKTVIIDHGLGIHTMYCHMSKILATEGEIVPKGTIIGKVGATGSVSGPHLHWGVKVAGNWISGLALAELPVFETTPMQALFLKTAKPNKKNQSNE